MFTESLYINLRAIYEKITFKKSTIVAEFVRPNSIYEFKF